MLFPSALVSAGWFFDLYQSTFVVFRFVPFSICCILDMYVSHYVGLSVCACLAVLLLRSTPFCLCSVFHHKRSGFVGISTCAIIALFGFRNYLSRVVAFSIYTCLALLLFRFVSFSLSLFIRPVAGSDGCFIDLNLPFYVFM